MVKVNGQLIEPRNEEDLVLIALNKPVGIVSTTESGEKIILLIMLITVPEFFQLAV